MRTIYFVFLSNQAVALDLSTACPLMRKDSDETITDNGISCRMDPRVLDYLRAVSWILMTDWAAKGFEIRNPNATSTAVAGARSTNWYL